MGENFVKIQCGYCSKEIKKSIGDINHAKKRGYGLFCNQTCSGLSHRHNKTEEQLKKEKSDYDKEFRIKNRERLKKQKHEAFKIDYAANPEKYRAIRKAKYEKHLLYLQSDKYKIWKKNYDEKRRAKIMYGEFAEASLVLKKIEDVLDAQLIKREQGITFNKSTQQRKRTWQRNSTARI